MKKVSRLAEALQHFFECPLASMEQMTKVFSESTSISKMEKELTILKNRAIENACELEKETTRQVFSRLQTGRVRQPRRVKYL